MSEGAFQARFVNPLRGILMDSREAVVNYEMPLGLHHLFGGTHYGPIPWDKMPPRPDWRPSYYHQADANGIGFDRTATGSDNVHQYNEPLASQFGNLDTCPENLILWFHHVPWDYKMRSGRTLWEELCLHYDTGISQVEDYRRIWESLKPYVAPALYEEVATKLLIQRNDAQWWRDACVGYFQQLNGLPLPSEVRPLIIPIDTLKGKLLRSDKMGMPVFDDQYRVVLDPIRPRQRR